LGKKDGKYYQQKAYSIYRNKSSGGFGLVDEESIARIEEGNKRIQRAMYETEYAAFELGGVMGDVFAGMANSISDALGETENIFKAFWKFFTDFIKGMIIKLVAATIAALALAVILSLIGLGPGLGKIGQGIAKMGSFIDIFKEGFGAFGGFKMASGGVVPGGYPNDTFPAMLSSGETVMTPQQMRNFGGSMDITLKTDLTRGEDLYWCIEEVKRKRNDTF
jgi:hypothetical protein